ncbi:hypothetical protein [Haloplanus aerogenes]|uniref:Uncharacterized protein n=1 Tax=Haloplanus aerogenes TaxID=660522 RepID=A0A3M0DHA7_9EURY|nr:hypothetical protein [Haloplanus aerogenes]AZH26051.1 hypothetical protein DU502_12090 [Haloplanus aerogenes]RMB18499.1 hypothetical protein ATH50_1959 [Haloplanus aerogenes]
MQRRTVLATLGSLSATAGCVGITPPRSDGRDRATGTGTSRTDGERPDADPNCPSFAADPDRTVCWPSEDRIRSRVFLNASTPVFEPDSDDLSAETVEFVLHDQHPDRSVGVDPHDWWIARRTGDGWDRIASGSTSDAWRTIDPGQRYTWSLSLQPHPTPRTDDTTYIVQALDDGTYAFGTVALLGGRADDALRIECVAVVEVRRR